MSDDSDNDWKGTAKFLVLLALGAWILRSFIVAPFVIPSVSMLPTMQVGDYLFVSKWPYGYTQKSMLFGIPPFEGRIFADTPERGDIVVFRSAAEPDKDVVKRVIGLPGDTVSVRGGNVILNGEPIPRRAIGDRILNLSPNSECIGAFGSRPIVQTENGPGCTYPAFVETLPGGTSYVTFDQANTALDNFEMDRLGARTVPEGHFFMLGDNRDQSGDSRLTLQQGGVAFVPMENVIGRAEFIWWSTDGTASWIKPWTWFTALRTDRLFKSYAE